MAFHRSGAHPRSRLCPCASTSLAISSDISDLSGNLRSLAISAVPSLLLCSRVAFAIVDLTHGGQRTVACTPSGAQRPKIIFCFSGTAGGGLQRLPCYTPGRVTKPRFQFSVRQRTPTTRPCLRGA